jgi:hypothetical protein
MTPQKTYKDTSKMTQLEAGVMILYPVGDTSPYDWQDPKNLVGFLREDVDARRNPIVRELREIVNSVNQKKDPGLTYVTQRELDGMDGKIKELVQPLDGYLTTQGVTQLYMFMQGILRAKYQPMPK